MSDVFDTVPDKNELARKRRAENVRAGDDAFLINALKSRSGRNYFWNFLEFCHLFEISYVQGSFDATSFREGQRNVGNKLMADVLRVAPEAWVTMMNEHSKKPVQPVESEEDAA